jgi:hypothetical protein
VIVSDLKLYSVEVSRLSIPRDHETIQVRTYSARRAQELMLETYPDCSARTLGVFFEGTWHRARHDDNAPIAPLSATDTNATTTAR